jgi:hypothetical protein
MPGTPGGDVTPAKIEEAILRQLASRTADATVCPSEVARALTVGDGAWRTLMPKVRQAAQRMAERGDLRVTRRGVEVDANSPGGPIRLGHPTKTNAGPTA